jgi:outer membrane receptor protein involved in Fe transport
MRAWVHGPRLCRLGVLTLIAILAIWLQPLHAQVSTAIRGTVVARSTGEPIAGATVAVEGSGSVRTNGVGRFELDQPGSVTVHVSAPGYVTARVSDLTSQTPATILVDLTPNFMERVQVTATKTSESVGDTAAAPTTIIDRATIDRRNDQRLTEAVEHVPGALVTTELGIFESVLLRGMPRVGNEFTNTLLLVDGVPQTNAGNDARVVALPIYDAASIEVVRGPNSALYGRTAIGGAINILTAEPTAKPEFKADLTGGGFGTAKGVVTASGPIQQWGGYYASLGRIRSGGYYKNLLDDDFDLGNTSFGTYSQAFLPPRRPSALQAADTQLNLKPEDIENYEAGLKGSVLGGRVALEASYFRMTEDGVVINRFINNRFIPSNAGQLTYKGFETGATWTPRQSVSAYANAAFYRNRYGDFVIQTDGGDRMLTGNRPVLSPDYIANWGMSVQPVSAVNVTIDVKHASPTFGNDSNTATIDG